MRRWGYFVHRHRRPVLALSCIAFVLSVFALLNGGQLKNAGDYNVESVKAAKLESQQLPSTMGSSFLLLFTNHALAYSDPAFQGAVESALAPLRSDRRVTGIQTPYTAAAAQASTMVSTDKHSIFAQVGLNLDFSTARRDFEQLRSEVRSQSLAIATDGDVPVASDFDTILAKDLQ